MPVLRRSLVPALILALPFAAGAPAPPGHFCLSQGQLIVMNVPVGLPRDSLVRLLGPASRTAGGQLLYPDLAVTLAADGRVTGLRPLTARALGPGGIHLGQRIEDVVDRVGASIYDQDFDEAIWEPAICRDGPLATGSPGPNAVFYWENLPGEFGTMVTNYPNRRLATLEFTLTSADPQ